MLTANAKYRKFEAKSLMFWEKDSLTFGWFDELH